jgi:hypothetical protein
LAALTKRVKQDPRPAKYSPVRTYAHVARKHQDQSGSLPEWWSDPLTVLDEDIAEVVGDPAGEPAGGAGMQCLDVYTSDVSGNLPSLSADSNREDNGLGFTMAAAKRGKLLVYSVHAAP